MMKSSKSSKKDSNKSNNMNDNTIITTNDNDNITTITKHNIEGVPDDVMEYHPLSELRNKLGCYPNVTKDHIKAYEELKELIQKAKIDPQVYGENNFNRLFRFLRARKFDPNAAFLMIQKNEKWRKEFAGLDLRLEKAEDILNCDLSKVYDYFPTWIQGYDKQSRPVSYRRFGKFEIWNILKLTTLESLVRFHAWESEQSLRLMEQKSQEIGYTIETFVIIIDALGWSLGLATSEAFAFIKSMASVDSDHYPERLGLCIIINAPSMLSFSWRVIAGFLDDVTKAKIKILGTDPNEWRPVLLSVIDEDQIPKMYGGTAPDLDGNMALLSMNPPPNAPGVKLRRPLSSVTLDENDDFTNKSIRDPKRKNENGEETTSSSSSSSGWLSSMFQCKPPTCSFGDDDFNYTIMIGSSPSTKLQQLENESVEVIKVSCDVQTQTEEIFLEPISSPSRAGCGCVIN
jgi:hypothetical protein